MERKLTDEEIIHNDDDFIAGEQEYDKAYEYASKIAMDISTGLVERIMKENNNEKYNLTTAILAVSMSLSHLAQFLYDDEETFLNDREMSRKAVVNDIIPALLHVEPCGECDMCKSGNPEQCINPHTTPEYTTARILPIIANMLIEFNVYWSSIWMHTINKGDNDNAKTEDGNNESGSNTGEGTNT